MRRKRRKRTRKSTQTTTTLSTPCKVDGARKCAGRAEVGHQLAEDAVDAEDAAPVEARADSLFHHNNLNGSEAANAFNVGRKATSNGIAHKQRGGRVASTSS